MQAGREGISSGVRGVRGCGTARTGGAGAALEKQGAGAALEKRGAGAREAEHRR